MEPLTDKEYIKAIWLIDIDDQELENITKENPNWRKSYYKQQQLFREKWLQNVRGGKKML